MTNTKLCMLALALATTAAGAQQMKTVVTYTNGSGSASEPDRDQAIDEATQQAENWANSSCIGSVTSTNTTSSGCIKLGSDDNTTYTCTVSVKARCEIEYRGSKS